tara:strand:+ start:188 stop:442 length:255 start_codon:yes stop_codon:yes gene_type:complete
MELKTIEEFLRYRRLCMMRSRDKKEERIWKYHKDGMIEMMSELIFCLGKLEKVSDWNDCFDTMFGDGGKPYSPFYEKIKSGEIE